MGRSSLGRLVGCLILLAGCASDAPISDPGDAGMEVSTAADTMIGQDSGSDVDVSQPKLPLDMPLKAGQVRAGIITQSQELLPGPKSEGRLGDIKIYNDRVAFVIENLRRASGYRYYGGNPVDAVAVHHGEFLPDTFGEFFYMWNFYLFSPEKMEIVNDGSDGISAHVRFTGRSEVFHFAAQFLLPLLPAVEVPDLDIVYDYYLAPDSPALRLEITLKNREDVARVIDYPLIFSHSGDGSYPYTPGLGFENWPMFEYMPYLMLADHRQAAVWTNAAGTIQNLISEGVVAVLSEEPFKIGPGETAQQVSWLGVSAEGPGGAQEIVSEIHDPQSNRHSISGQVTLPDTAFAEDTWIGVRKNDAVEAIAPVDADGRFRLRLLSGDYKIRAFSERHAPSDWVSVNVSGELEGIALSIAEAAKVVVEVTDVDSGQPIGARVTFTRLGDTPSVYPPSDMRPQQKTWSGDTSAVAYVTGAPEPVTLPAGTYRLLATRGFSYDYQTREITVQPGSNPKESFTLKRAVDTTGWLSSDFHIHALWSPDSYTPYDVRIKQAIAEDLDLPILTEHVYVSGLGKTADTMGLSEHVMGVVGQEVTTFGYGHFNAFPLVWDPTAPNNGAILPYNKDPVALFEAMRNQSSKDVVIAVNHPRGAALGSYFTYVGLNAADDTVEKPNEWSTNWEAIEVFNGKCHGSSNLEALGDWIGFTNNGYRKTLASGSDVHGESAIPGFPRNWIRVEEADVRADHHNLVPAVRNRQLFVSCGPFVRFSAVDDAGGEVGLGGRVATDNEGKVTFRVRVEAPAWIGVKEVRLWENGKPIDLIDVSDSLDPVVRLDTELSVAPVEDAWYAIEVIGQGTLAPVRNDTPYALTNPIEVDADGDGEWTPPGKKNP